MARLSIFQPQGQGAATVDEKPVYNKPFQPYVGKDEVNRRATSFSPRQRTMPPPNQRDRTAPPPVDPAQRERTNYDPAARVRTGYNPNVIGSAIALGSIPPTPPRSTTGFGSTPQPGSIDEAKVQQLRLQQQYNQNMAGQGGSNTSHTELTFGGTIPVPQPPPLTGGQTYGDVVGAGGGGINPGNGSVRPTPIPGGVQPYPVPLVPRQRAFVPSIYNTPFQQ